MNGFSRVTPILEGYSSDKKYLVGIGDQKLLLRTFKPEELPRKSEEFEALKMMVSRKVKCSAPIELGMDESGQVAYMVLSYVEGTDAEKAVLYLSHREQYDLGFQAGVELFKVNSCEAPLKVTAWDVRKSAKHQRYIKKYWEQDVRVSHDRVIERFIEDHMSLMKDRPNRFQHDDFHIRNMIVDGKDLSGIIDFGRFDWGDPIHEFLKVGQFSSEVSVPFSVGQIHGYFGGTEPNDEFWSLYSLYLAMSVFSSVVWTGQVCPDEMPSMLKILERVINDHQDFSNLRPSWYTNFSAKGL
ncbi:aminoglycoside phosphotransferase family protein [Bdellovibrio bacteriovorus]|uniref:aminoglycoside phosphotransferase family protein n=1 Tax=Bdellovibrio bacteriovorus TaxID=959 RepID=UPI0012F71C28|nr:aminoglycoside phosphotransferase family protein [Bdellovibrio bacteriovorus]